MLAGWLYVYASATGTALIWSTVWLAAGVVGYPGWARYHHHWPFGPKQIREVPNGSACCGPRRRVPRAQGLGGHVRRVLRSADVPGPRG